MTISEEAVKSEREKVRGIRRELMSMHTVYL